jgi:Tol biopolymer transport system component
VRAERELNIWIVPNGDASRAKQITFGSGNNYGLKGLCWTRDGKAVYSAGPLGNENIWITEPDGTGQRQLTVAAHSSFEPAVSPDGRYIVFVSDRTGSTNIWRMDLDGSNLKQLTSSGNASQPTCSLDSRWVVYRISTEKNKSLWKVSIDGGDALQLRDKNSIRPAISPDGRLIAYCYDEKPNSYKIAIIPFEGGPPIRVFDLPPDANTVTLRWAPDGRALTYVVRTNGIANIWRQPLDGEPPIQLTDFKTDEIFWFDWSRDGKQLACSRGADKSDVVLVSNSK